jgi:hypothetical protein
MNKDHLMIFQMMSAITCNSNEFFASHEMEERMGQFVNTKIHVTHILATMKAIPDIIQASFKT